MPLADSTSRTWLATTTTGRPHGIQIRIARRAGGSASGRGSESGRRPGRRIAARQGPTLLRSDGRDPDDDQFRDANRGGLPGTQLVGSRARRPIDTRVLVILIGVRRCDSDACPPAARMRVVLVRLVMCFTVRERLARNREGGDEAKENREAANDQVQAHEHNVVETRRPASISQGSARNRSPSAACASLRQRERSGRRQIGQFASAGAVPSCAVTGPRTTIAFITVSFTVTVTVTRFPCTRPTNRAGSDGPTATGYARSRYVPATSNSPEADTGIRPLMSPKVHAMWRCAELSPTMNPALSPPQVPIPSLPSDGAGGVVVEQAAQNTTLATITDRQCALGIARVPNGVTRPTHRRYDASQGNSRVVTEARAPAVRTPGPDVSGDPLTPCSENRLNLRLNPRHAASRSKSIIRLPGSSCGEDRVMHPHRSRREHGRRPATRRLRAHCGQPAPVET